MFLQEDKHCDGAATRMAIGTGQLESSRQPAVNTDELLQLEDPSRDDPSPSPSSPAPEGA